MLRTIINRTDWILEKIMGLMCLVLLVCLFVEVLNRYVFFTAWRPIQYIIPFCFVWMCMIGSALAVRRGQHFVVDLLSKLFTGRPRKIHRAVIMGSVIAGGVLILWSSVGFVQLGSLKRNAATGYPMVYIYLSLLIGGGLIALMGLEQLFTDPGRAEDEAQL